MLEIDNSISKYWQTDYIEANPNKKKKKREKQKKKESRSKVEDGEGGVRISVDMEIDRVLVFWSSVLEFRLPPGMEWEKKKNKYFVSGWVDRALSDLHWAESNQSGKGVVWKEREMD